MQRIWLILGLVCPLALADSYPPSHDCTEPDIPYEFNDQFEKDQFFSDVAEYKSCIQDFVDEQSQAVRNHTAASDDAVSEWNSFARRLK